MGALLPAPPAATRSAGAIAGAAAAAQRPASRRPLRVAGRAATTPLPSLSTVVGAPPERVTALTARSVEGVWLTAIRGAVTPRAVATGLIARSPTAVIPSADLTLSTARIAAREVLAPLTRNRLGGPRGPEATGTRALALRPLAIIPGTERLRNAVPAVLTGETAATTPILPRVSPLLNGIAGVEAAMEPKAATATCMGTPIAGVVALPAPATRVPVARP